MKLSELEQEIFLEISGGIEYRPAVHDQTLWFKVTKSISKIYSEHYSSKVEGTNTQRLVDAVRSWLLDPNYPAKLATRWYVIWATTITLLVCLLLK